LPPERVSRTAGSAAVIEWGVLASRELTRTGTCGRVDNCSMRTQGSHAKGLAPKRRSWQIASPRHAIVSGMAGSAVVTPRLVFFT